MVPGTRLSLPILFLFLSTCIVAKVSAQDSEARFLSGPEFVLSADGIAAGIDGTVAAGLSIDDAGNVTGVTVYGDPVWPCGKSPDRELKSVRSAVDKHLRLLKFSPALKNGKPRSTNVLLEYAVGDGIRRAVPVNVAKKNASPTTAVRLGPLNPPAVSLAKPIAGVRRGVVIVQVLIDEQGRVRKAGLHKGDRLLSGSSLDAACESIFAPVLIAGQPVQAWGFINYIYH